MKFALCHNLASTPPAGQGLHVLELGVKESWLFNISTIVIRRAVFVELLLCAMHSITSFNLCNSPVKQVLLYHSHFINEETEAQSS